MKKTLIAIILLICLGCKTNNTKAQNANQITISEPKRVLDSIITVAKTQSLYRENVDWSALEKQIYDRFEDSDTITSIIEPVKYLLTELEDFHGSLFFKGQHYKGTTKRKRNVTYDYQSKDYFDKMSNIYQKTVNQDIIKGFIVNENIAYIEIPLIMPYGGDATEVMKQTVKIRNKVCELNDKKPNGWIIDIRGNLGGNVYPMLMGLAEMLPLQIDLGGDSYDGNSIRDKWKLDDGIFYYGGGSYQNIPKLSCNTSQTNKETKVAVLISRYTASSGEVVACALKGQKNIKIFGEQTSGATTANSWTPIGKDVVFNPAISYYVSKDKTVHKDGIIPDTLITEDYDINNPTEGKVFEIAKEWIIEQ